MAASSDGQDRPRATRRKRSAPGTVTIKEIAELSGVSSATVTRALQGHPRVRPETRARVQQAADKLGYRPNDIARTLATGASKTIGLLLPSIGDRYWGEVVAGIEDGADEAGFSVLLATSHGDTSRSRRMLDVLLSKRVDGVLVASRRDVEEALAQAPLPVPLVRIGPDAEFHQADVDAAGTLAPADLADWLQRRGLAHPPHGVTAFDDVDAATIAVEHLAQLGHRRLAFVGAGTRRSAALRVVGFRERAGRIGSESATVVTSPDSLEESDRASRALLEGPARPTAVVAYDDMVAIGVIRAAHAIGLRVPEELSVVGIDDIDVAAFLEPPLTTVRQPKRELGRRATDALLTVLRGGAMPAGQALRGELILRGSTAPVRGV
jgi:DNA-binding LacI/PurR family transcriptional regulator